MRGRIGDFDRAAWAAWRSSRRLSTDRGDGAPPFNSPPFAEVGCSFDADFRVRVAPHHHRRMRPNPFRRGYMTREPDGWFMVPEHDAVWPLADARLRHVYRCIDDEDDFLGSADRFVCSSLDEPFGIELRVHEADVATMRAVLDEIRAASPAGRYAAATGRPTGYPWLLSPATCPDCGARLRREVGFAVRLRTWGCGGCGARWDCRRPSRLLTRIGRAPAGAPDLR